MNYLEDLGITKVALCKRGQNPGAEILLFKADDPKPGEAPNHQEAPVADVTKSEELEARIAELESEREALTTMTNDDLAALRGFEIAKSEQPDEIDKSALPESVRKALDEAEGLKARVEKMERDQRAAQFVTKAAEFSHIAGAAELGPVLEEIDRLAPEVSKRLDTYMKAAQARLAEAGLFDEIGTAKAAVVSEADALIAKAMESGASKEAAMRQVFNEHPELYPVSAPGADG